MHKVVAELIRGKSGNHSQELAATWFEQYEETFQTLKQKLTTAPVLDYTGNHLNWKLMPAMHGYE